MGGLTWGGIPRVMCRRGRGFVAGESRVSWGYLLRQGATVLPHLALVRYHETVVSSFVAGPALAGQPLYVDFVLTLLVIRGYYYCVGCWRAGVLSVPRVLPARRVMRNVLLVVFCVRVCAYFCVFRAPFMYRYVLTSSCSVDTRREAVCSTLDKTFAFNKKV